MATLRGVRVVRLSVLTDETTSPERQRSSTDYAAALEGIEFDGREALDLGVSASKTAPMDRPELGSWLARPEEFDALVAWRFDRLVRSMNDMNELSKWAADHRKVVVFAEGPGGKLTLDFRNPLDPVAQLMLTVFAFAAQMEAMAIQERVAGAQAALRSMPLRWRGSRPPYGYKPEKMDVGWTLVPDPETGQVIADMVKALRRGESPTAIAAQMTADGVLTARDHWAAHQGRRTADSSRERLSWSAQAVVQILTSPVMIGWKTHQGKPVRNDKGEPVMCTTSPLMSREEYDEVAALLSARAVSSPVQRKDTNALLAGVLLCGGCGGPMYLSKLGTRPATYKCGFRSRRRRCEAPSAVKVEWADEYAERTFLHAVGSLELSYTRVIPGYDPAPELAATMAEFEEHQEQAGRQSSSAAKAAWQKRADALDARLAELESRETLPTRTETVGTGRTYGSDWESTDTAGRRKIMQGAGFTITCVKGSSGGWRRLDESRMSWDISDENLREAADELLAIARVEERDA